MRYPNEIPDIIDCCITPGSQSDPRQWPEYLRQDPVRGYGLYCFYQGIAWASSWRRSAGSLSPVQRHHRHFRPVEQPEGGTGVAQARVTTGRAFAS